MGVICKCCVLLAVLGAACTKKVNECSSDSDCKDIAYPFCDVDGQYAASGGEHDVCTIVPPDCPIDRCGCSPGAVSCSNADLETCNADGKSTTSTACGLGCAASNDRCATFKASNGLDTAINAAVGEPAAIFSLDVVIDTDACVVHDSANNQLTVKTLKLSQTSGPEICAIVAGSFDMGNVSALGTSAVAFAATGPITIHGKLDVAAHPSGHPYLGPPGMTTTGSCIAPDNGTESGGGGNATKGGDGIFLASVPSHRAGGLAQTSFTPLTGGCRGGLVTDGDGGGMFGWPGGAVQLVSNVSVTITSSAVIALGGSGGTDGGGGGSGGTCIIESPSVTISGTVAANGGGGGFASPPGCPSAGGDATNDMNPAPGGTGSCAPTYHGGAGGIGTTAAQDGTIHGGGGGSVGRILIRTADGTFTGPGPIFSIAKTTDTLVKI